MNSSMPLEEIRDRIRGSLIGGAVGDALGYPNEFNLNPKRTTKYKNDRGLISDDTQMALFTANALLWRETRWAVRGLAMLPPEAIYLGYRDWLSTQQRLADPPRISWIRTIPELNVVRAPGRTCLESLNKNTPGTLADPINDSKGCGGIMRLAPIPLYITEPYRAAEFAAESCALTHGHPAAILSAYALSMLIYYARTGSPLNDAAESVLADMHNWYPKLYRDEKPFTPDWSDEKTDLEDLLSAAINLAHYRDLPDEIAIESLGAGWTADEALAIAIYCSLKYHNNFEKAVSAAVSHPGDSDSTGAITGNIIGAHLGCSKIPAYFKDHLELKSTILELADDLTTGVPTDPSGAVTDETWLAKYFYITKKPQ